MKNVETIDVEQVKGRMKQFIRNQNLIDKHFILVRQSDIITQTARLNQPIRVPERRILHVIEGEADYRINLIDHKLRQGDFLLLPPNVILEVLYLSSDFSVEALAIIDLPGINDELIKSLLNFDVYHLSLGREDGHRVTSYFDMIAQQMNRTEHSDSAISHLILSLIADIRHQYKTSSSATSLYKLSRGEKIMSGFVNLLHQFGTTQRSIPFYAKQLAITPNYLSDVVRQQSGMSVMDWINRNTVTEAKVLLKYTDLMIYEISNRFNFPEPSAFNRFFKKHVGMTPLEYREN